MKTKFKILILTLAMVFAFGTVVPAKAFYIEIPQILKDAVNSIKTSNTSAQESSTMTPSTGDTIFCDALGKQTTRDECGAASNQQSGSTMIFCNALGRQATKDECDGPTSQQPDNTIIFCNVLGKQTTKGECPGTNPQPQQNNNQPPQNQNQPPQNNQPNQQMMNQGGQGQQDGQNGQNGQGMMPGGKGGQGNGGNQNFLKDVQRGAKQMDRSLTQFDALVKSTEKAGGTVSAEMKDKADQLRKMMETAKAAKSADDLQDFDMGEAGNIAQDLEQYRRDLQDQTQRLKQVKQQIRNADQAVTSFEKQIAKAKDCVSPEIKTQIETLKTTIATIKNAKTWDEVQSAGIDNMGDMFSSLNDSKDQLDACSRWPQILKQVDKQLKDLDKQVAKSKLLVTKLSVKGIDLSVPFNAFADGVTKLKSIREDAVAKMQSNDAQGAFDLLQNDFFGQLDDVMQNQQIIQTMSNLGSFNSQYKRELTSEQSQINTLKRKKIDTADLESTLADVKTKGAEILDLIKQKDVDLETITSDMGDLQDLRTQFSDQIAELTGVDNSGMNNFMGPSQFKSIQMPTGMNQFFNQPQSSQQQPQPSQEMQPQQFQQSQQTPTVVPGKG